MTPPLTATIESPGRVLLTLAGDLRAERIEDLKTAITAAREEIRRASDAAVAKVHILMDISAFSGEYDVEAMELMAAFAKGNAEYVEKTAVFGGPERGVMAGEAVAALAGRDNIQLFPTRDEALAWFAR